MFKCNFTIQSLAEKYPPCLITLLTLNTLLFKLPNRRAKYTVTIDKLKTNYTKNLFLYKTLKLYNGLKGVLKLLLPNKFKIRLKKGTRRFIMLNLLVFHKRLKSKKNKVVRKR